jgi:predicted transcriptional regulator
LYFIDSELDGFKPSSLTGQVAKSERTILQVLFPAVRAEVLRLLFNPPLKQRYVRELMGMSNLALHTVQDELRKLKAIGLIESWSNGYHRFYRPNREHTLFKPLQQIVQASERLPGTKHRLLHRSSAQRKMKSQVRRGPSRMETDFPAKWQIFSGGKTTRRL